MSREIRSRALGYCFKCKELSVRAKVYGKEGKRVEYCINKGCGYKLQLPLLRKERSGQ
jgi:hypothetical protein